MSDAIKKTLTDILKDMDIPTMRRELTTPNLRWLARNLLIRNRDKPEFGTAIHFIQHLLWCEDDKTET